MEFESLDPVGAIAEGVDLTSFSADDAPELRAALAEHGVIVFTSQELDDDGFVAFLEALGALTFTVGETPVEGHPDLNVVSNVGRADPPRSSFHVDTSYVREPPAYTSLRAVQIPESGGATQFSNQFRAYETLPIDVRTKLDGRTITHVVSGLDLDDDAETEADHPIFRPHPLTGRIALYMTTPKRCAAISGMKQKEADEVIDFLFEHSTQPENVLDHQWSAGDVVIWDNACVLHRADHNGVVGDRVMHRGMVAGYG